MKKQLLLGSALLLSISALPQSNREKPKSTGLENTSLIAELKFGNEEIASEKNSGSSNQIIEVESENNSSSKSNALNTWQKISGSMNILNSVISYCNPLQYDDELNAVSFIHRKSATYSISPTPAATGAITGGIIGMVSTNWGNTWDSTALWVNETEWARYPQGGIYNPPGNTNINNAYIVAQGPTTGAAGGWLGNFYASKQLGSSNYNNAPSTVPNAMQFMSKNPPFSPGLNRHDFAAYGFTSTDDGKLRTIGGITDEAIASDTAIMLVTGSFNAGVFTWTGTQFNPPTLTNSATADEVWLSRPMMAWNETGTVGYVAVIGARAGETASNKGYQPIVYKTTNSGVSWSLLPSINFNDPSFDDVKRSIVAAGNGTIEIPFFNWIEGMDMAVDANNKLHIFSSVIGTAIDHPDSLAYISSFTLSVNPGENYRWPHTPGYRPYLYDFIGDGTGPWSHVTVDSMSSEGPAGSSTGNGFSDNPWDVDASGNKPRIDARLQLSRTPNGQHIIYTWAESDTNFTQGGRKWNSIPNIKARCYSTLTSSVHPVEINVTKPVSGSNPNVLNRAMYHFSSPKTSTAAVGPLGPRMTLPLTISTGNPYTQTAPQHWYASADLNFGTVGVSENELNNVTSSIIYPNPAHDKAVLLVDLKNNSLVKMKLINVIGEVVKTHEINGTAGENVFNLELNGLTPGIYFVNLESGNNTITKKLIVK